MSRASPAIQSSPICSSTSSPKRSQAWTRKSACTCASAIIAVGQWLGAVYGGRAEVARALAPIVNQEMKELVRAGADFLALDEPSFACHPEQPDLFLDIIAKTVAGVDAKISMHMCFGNYRGRAVARRRLRRPRGSRASAGADCESRDEGTRSRRRRFSCSR